MKLFEFLARRGLPFRTTAGRLNGPPTAVSRPYSPHRRQGNGLGLPIAEETGPADLLKRQDCLWIFDDENLRLSARDHDLAVSYQALVKWAQGHVNRSWFHAIYSAEPGSSLAVSRAEYFRQRSITPHIQPIEKDHGHRPQTNADNFVLFMAGLLVSRSPASVVILGTGDGDLGHDLCRFIQVLPKARTLVTLSIANSTSQRLNAEINDYVDGNIELGMDCFRPSRNPQGENHERTQSLATNAEQAVFGTHKRPIH